MAPKRWSFILQCTSRVDPSPDRPTLPEFQTAVMKWNEVMVSYFQDFLILMTSPSKKKLPSGMVYIHKLSWNILFVIFFIWNSPLTSNPPPKNFVLIFHKGCIWISNKSCPLRLTIQNSHPLCTKLCLVISLCPISLSFWNSHYPIPLKKTLYQSSTERVWISNKNCSFRWYLIDFLTGYATRGLKPLSYPYLKIFLP